MLEAEVERSIAAGAVASVKAHDSKRFRLRAVNHEAEIYQRYFHKFIASRVSWIQLGFSGFVLVIQMVVMFLLMDHYEFYNTSSNLGTGIWSNCFTIFASVTTLWACKKPSYGKLHTAMALHIISVLFQIIGTFILFCSTLPEIQKSIREVANGVYQDKYNYGRTYSHGIYDIDSSTTENYRDQKTKHLLETFNLTFTLSGIMALFAVLQTLMSFFMSLKTGRAICCGRSHLEGKFLEMEAVGREDADAIVNFRVGGKNQQHQRCIHRMDSLGPPPSYTPELIVPNVNATLNSSKDKSSGSNE